METEQAWENLKREVEKAIAEGYKWHCGWCGEIYKERPFMCQCRSNAFLHELNAACFREMPGKYQYNLVSP